jgi:transcription initiation factor IIE alpha subunit
MEERPHTVVHLGETCPVCGTYHRVVETISNSPLTTTAIDQLEESKKVHFARGVGMMGGSVHGVKTDELVSETLVFSTKSSTCVLSRFEEAGWIVAREIEHEESDIPSEVGEAVWLEESAKFSEAFHDVFG